MKEEKYMRQFLKFNIDKSTELLNNNFGSNWAYTNVFDTIILEKIYTPLRKENENFF